MLEHTDEEQLADKFAGLWEKLKQFMTALQIIWHITLMVQQKHLWISLDQYPPGDVECIIQGMPTKHCESDAILTSLLKEILLAVAPSLAKISLKHGIFAASWKVAIIRPLLKKVGMDLITRNYRPVNNLVFLSKVLEKVVLEQFTTHCDTHKFIPDYQSAYRKNFSWETSIIKVVNDVLWNFEHQEVCAMCMIDLSAAFTMVDHQILLQVLQSRFGVSGSALAWFESYLWPRFCKVKVGTKFSTIRSLDCLVPQGSLAGPNLYSVLHLHPARNCSWWCGSKWVCRWSLLEKIF